MTTLKVKFTGSNVETLKFIEKKAGENGYNHFYRDRISEIWPKYTDPGVDVYEDWFYRYVGAKKEVLHLITENDFAKVKGDRANKLLTINND